ncbi:MAG TPA: hypothetical protein DCQ64_23965 [Candidatus Rokubacteria bacterium]|nr:hypothetical protein [Candidatus Rokubacteria bacterium]
MDTETQQTDVMPDLTALRCLRGPDDIWWQTPDRMHAQYNRLVERGLVERLRDRGLTLYKLSAAGREEAEIGEGPLPRA